MPQELEQPSSAQSFPLRQSFEGQDGRTQQQKKQEEEKVKDKIELLEIQNKRLDMLNEAIAKETNIGRFLNLLQSY